MQIIPTSIPEVVIIEPHIFRDGRGYFFESFSEQRFAELVTPTHFVQDNESRSSYGVVRGLHFSSHLTHRLSSCVSSVDGYLM